MGDPPERNRIIYEIDPTSWDILIQLVMLSTVNHTSYTISTEKIMCGLMNTIHAYLKKTKTHQVFTIITEPSRFSTKSWITEPDAILAWSFFHNIRRCNNDYIRNWVTTYTKENRFQFDLRWWLLDPCILGIIPNYLVGHQILK